MKHFHWYFYVGLGLFQSPPCRYLQRTLLFLCPIQLHEFEDNCFHWTQISFLSIRIRPSISWVGPGYNYTEFSSSHQCVRILSCHLVCSNNLFYLLQLFFICSNFIEFAATLFYLQQLSWICCNLILFPATLFYLQQLYWICCNFILFAATFLFAACPLWATVIMWCTPNSIQI